jgi:type IV pilus assembly protein PilM
VMESLGIGREEAESLIRQGSAGLLRKLGGGAGAEVLTGQIDRLVSELAGEVRRTLEFYQVQNRHVSISNVYITGGGAKMDNLPKKLSAILELPVSLHDPLASMEISSSFDRQYLQGVGPQMGVAVGLAMRGGE